MTNPTEINESFFSKHTDLLICFVLLISIYAVYGQVKDFDFIFFDDNLYVAENQNIKNGFSVKGVHWAFLFKDRDYKTYWHPLTWLSHMLDSHLFGLDAGKHHLANLFFHMANSLLLFVVFVRMTGSKWPSAFAAALFALHPMNVESVAWVAERKNVLSTFFWLLTMLTYINYTQKPSHAKYLTAFAVFAMGLMAKPMLVTLPFVLLLLDFWPLERLNFTKFQFFPENRSNKVFPCLARKVSVYRAIIEKVPFLLLSGILVYLSSAVLSSFNTMVAVEKVPVLLRLSNALVTYVKYMLKMIFPRKLNILYLFPEHIAWWKVTAATVILVIITLMVVKEIKRRPYLFLGWFWYLGTLVPVIGLVQAGLWPEMADRWAYVPFIGLFIMAAWGLGELFAALRINRLGLSILAGTALMIFSALTWAQLRHWQNSITILNHSLRVNPQNIVAHLAYGDKLETLGKETEAIRHYAEALKISPGFVGAHINLGGALARQGNIEKAIFHFKQALRIAPDNAGAHFNIGKAYADLGDLKSAIDHYVESIRLEPKFIKAYNNLANVLFMQEKIEDAIRVYQDALKIEPGNDFIKNNLAKLTDRQERDNALLLKLLADLKENSHNYQVHIKIGNIYKAKNEWGKAKNHYLEALSIELTSAEATQHLGIVSAMAGEYETARFYFKKNIVLKPEAPDAYYFIAGTYARQNRAEDAVEWLKKAVAKGFDNWQQLIKDQNFNSIRHTAYYKRLVENR
ncbi:MAG: tetratricopeptide repeat protein [Desulfobacterales bacterium]|nr:tetratricopeptide repeat protein [Desulfobacterales bacterium]